MPVQSGGTISFSDLQTHLGGSHPITMGEYSSYRTSGSGSTISLTHFYNASASVDTQTVTVGRMYMNIYGNIINYWGKFGTSGSISDGTCDFKSGSNIFGAYYYSNSGTSASQVGFIVDGTHTNAGFTTMNVAGSNFSRSSASFSTNSGRTYWVWNSLSNPYGTTQNVTKTVTFS